MAKRSIQAPGSRPLTHAEIKKIAIGVLEEVRKIVPRGNSLIADELDADFLERVTESLKGATTTEGRNHPARHSPIEPYLEPKGSISRESDNVRRCLMRKMIRERLGHAGSIAKLTLIPRGKQG